MLVASQPAASTGSRIGRLITGVFGVGMLLVAAVALVAPRNSWFVFDRTVVLASTTVVWR